MLQMERGRSSFRKAIAPPWCLGPRQGGKAYSEPYLSTMGCVVGVDVDIVMWPCSDMRLH